MITRTAKTTNFIQLYQHLMGKSEVPPQYHLWGSLSLMAACVANRIWLEKFKGSKLAPNLYVLLLGPSGCGKGIAIDHAIDFVKDISCVNMYRGKVTAPHMIDHLGRTRKLPTGQRVLENSKMYLITPELAMSVGSGPVGDDFIKMMTELYTGGEYVFQYGTRTSGNVTTTGHCINWLAGSTEQWLIRSLSRDAIEGGALARIAIVPAKYNYDIRYVRPLAPTDYDLVHKYLEARVHELCGLEGEMTRTIEAIEIEEQWYDKREKPSDDSLAPTWRRQHDLMLKLAMLYSLADSTDMVIRKQHIIAAKRLSYKVLAPVPSLVTLASTPPEQAGLLFVREVIRRAGSIRRYRLAARCSKRGIPAKKLDEFIYSLKCEGVIKQIYSKYNAVVYEWRQRRLLKEIENGCIEPPEPEETEGEGEGEGEDA